MDKVRTIKDQIDYGSAILPALSDSNNNLPKHVVIVPDGNRRWAKKRGRPSFFGHQAGLKAGEEIAQVALDSGLNSLTAWGCSVGNLTGRSRIEVAFLYKLFDSMFRKLLKNKDLEKHGVRVRILGRWEEFFPKKTQAVMRQLIEKTKDHKEKNFTLLMAYSGVDEMISAVNSISKKKDHSEITPDILKQNLWTKDLPPVDLVIRTGGEPHWSQGLMMFDVAEARLYFTETLWPDFDKKEFQKALGSFAKAERRFGK